MIPQICRVVVMLLMSALSTQNIWAQTQEFGPKVTGHTARYQGDSGGATTRYYWVQAIYPGGRAPISTYSAAVGIATLTRNSFVQVSWPAMPGAIAYDVFRTTSTSAPTGACNCAIAVRTTSTTARDFGTLINYTVAPTTAAGGFISAGTAADTATLSAAQMLGGLLTGTPTAAAAYTTPTATALVAAMSNCAAGRMYELIVKNTSAGNFTITMTAGTDLTISGTATVAQNHARIFKLVATNCTTPAVTLYSIVDSAF